MPKQGVVSTFKIGYAFGQIASTCALSRIPYSIISANTWKRSLGLARDKDKTISATMVSGSASDLKEKDEHRAEALLIANYGSKQIEYNS